MESQDLLCPERQYNLVFLCHFFPCSLATTTKQYFVCCRCAIGKMHRSCTGKVGELQVDLNLQGVGPVLQCVYKTQKYSVKCSCNAGTALGARIRARRNEREVHQESRAGVPNSFGPRDQMRSTGLICGPQWVHRMTPWAESSSQGWSSVGSEYSMRHRSAVCAAYSMHPSSSPTRHV